MKKDKIILYVIIAAGFIITLASIYLTRPASDFFGATTVVTPYVSKYGNNTFSGTNVFNSNVGISTSSPYKMLSVAGEILANNFTATSTAATSTFTNIVSSNNASTTNLTVSGNCVGCNGTPTIKTATCSLSGGTPSVCTATVTCDAGYVIAGGGNNDNSANCLSYFRLRSYPSSTTAWTVWYSCDNSACGTVTAYAVCIKQ